MLYTQIQIHWLKISRCFMYDPNMRGIIFQVQNASKCLVTTSLNRYLNSGYRLNFEAKVSAKKRVWDLNSVFGFESSFVSLYLPCDLDQDK